MAHPDKGRARPLASLRRRLAQLDKTIASEGFVRELDCASRAEIGSQLALVLDEMRARWSQEDELLQFLTRRARADLESERIRRDKSEDTKAQLHRLREQDDYELAWEESNPLVSVRIASYRDTEALVQRAIPSVLNQSHQNLELIIVNDGPNDLTREAVRSFNDPRIRYEEFPVRSLYPEDAHLRWMVAGSPGMNRGAELARGRWIAPLDDDDEFTNDHIEKLLNLAREKSAEFAYGAIDQLRVRTGESVRVFSTPPTAGQISMQAAIYHSGLRFMKYDIESWRVDEPGDWNLIRRMQGAGVTIASTPDYVTKVHMVHFTQKDAR